MAFGRFDSLLVMIVVIGGPDPLQKLVAKVGVPMKGGMAGEQQVVVVKKQVWCCSWWTVLIFEAELLQLMTECVRFVVHVLVEWKEEKQRAVVHCFSLLVKAETSYTETQFAEPVHMHVQKVI